MRRVTMALLGALSALLGVLTTVATVYGLTLADAWSREHIGLPTSFAGYHVVALPDARTGLSQELRRAIGNAPVALVVNSGADTGAAALGVLDTTGTLPILSDIDARTSEEVSAGDAPRVLVVDGTYTAEQFERSGTAIFLPPGATVVGSISDPMLPRDTQYVYGLTSAPLPSGDYFISAPDDVGTEVVNLLADGGYRVEPLERSPLAQAVLEAPFTTVFTALLLGALACFVLVAANQFTFHRARVVVHRLHGAHTRAMLRLLLPPGLLAIGAGTAVGSAAILLLGRHRLDFVSAEAGWIAAGCLAVGAATLGVVFGARRTRTAVL